MASLWFLLSAPSAGHVRRNFSDHLGNDVVTFVGTKIGATARFVSCAFELVIILKAHSSMMRFFNRSCKPDGHTKTTEDGEVPKWTRITDSGHDIHSREDISI